MKKTIYKIVENVIKFLPIKYRASLAGMILQYFDVKIITPYLKDRLMITTPDITFVPLLLTRNYNEISDIEFVKRFIRPEMIILDIGANIGYYSLLFADVVQSGGGHVYSFEPTPSTFKALQDNICVNRFSEKTITIHNVALYKENAVREFHIYDPKFYSGLNTFGKRDITLDGKKIIPEIQTLECKTLNSIATEKKLERIDFIKIDVEGSELSILQGGEQLLRDSAQNDLFVIMAEVSDDTLRDSGTSSKELFTFIDNLGLQIGAYDAGSNKVLHCKRKEYYGNSNLLFCKNIDLVNLSLQNIEQNL